MLTSVRASVSGRVQGVGFRYFTRDAAEASGAVTGWVRNEDDGGVEIYAEGSKEELENFLSRIRQGPPMSRVTDLRISWAQVGERTLRSFRIEI